jgi:Domain of unknown function (DUF1918)
MEVAMAKTVHGKPARAGDKISVAGNAVGVPGKMGEILEVMGESGHERFRVRWEDGHESIFFPADDASIERPSTRMPTKA